MSTSAVAHAHAHSAHPPTTTGLDHRKVAIWAFIGSECMLFASLISTYLIYKGRSRVGPFPHEYWCQTTNATSATPIAGCPAGSLLKPILNIPVTSQSTFVLLMSSLAMVLALAAVENKGKPQRTLGERILGNSKLWCCETWLACVGDSGRPASCAGACGTAVRLPGARRWKRACTRSWREREFEMSALRK